MLIAGKKENNVEVGGDPPRPKKTKTKMKRRINVEDDCLIPKVAEKKKNQLAGRKK